MKTCARLTGGIALIVAKLADASPLETPDKGSPLHRAILDGLRASRPMQELSQAWHAKVVFTDVHIRPPQSARQAQDSLAAPEVRL